MFPEQAGLGSNWQWAFREIDRQRTSRPEGAGAAAESPWWAFEVRKDRCFSREGRGWLGSEGDGRASLAVTLLGGAALQPAG